MAPCKAGAGEAVLREAKGEAEDANAEKLV